MNGHLTMFHVNYMLRQLDEAPGVFEGEFGISGQVLLSSLYLGPDENKVQAFTSLPMEEVQVRAQRLRENGIWTESGKIALDLGDENDSRHVAIGLIMAIMCTNGDLVRVNGMVSTTEKGKAVVEEMKAEQDFSGLDEGTPESQESSEPLPEPKPKKKRGFAAMDPEKVREIASKGGKAAHIAGTAHEFTSKEASEAGRKGGHASHASKKAKT